MKNLADAKIPSTFVNRAHIAGMNTTVRVVFGEQIDAENVHATVAISMSIPDFRAYTEKCQALVAQYNQMEQKGGVNGQPSQIVRPS